MKKKTMIQPLLVIALGCLALFVSLYVTVYRLRNGYCGTYYLTNREVVINEDTLKITGYNFWLSEYTLEDGTRIHENVIRTYIKK